jgi:mannose-1-phosphate guanylyltransferase
MKIAIMCGGGGTRLWPLSRLSMPKQFARLMQPIEAKSLFQQTLIRNSKLADEFLIFVSKDQLHLAKMQFEEIALNTKVRFIAEPFGKNTAAVVAMASTLLGEHDDVLVTPSDHYIANEESYIQQIQDSKKILTNNKICLFGIKPNLPETGFGYIHYQMNEVLSFKEKPDLATAQQYVAAGNYLWNSGIFAFKAKTMKSEMQIHKPNLINTANNLKNIIEVDNTIFITPEIMNEFENISIDYAVIEKSKELAIVETNDWEWSDLGSFEALKKLKRELNHDVHLKGSNNSLVISNKETILIDVDDLIVVDTGDALLISKEGSSSKVKEVLKDLKNQNLKIDHSTVVRPWGSYSVLTDEQHCKVKRLEVLPGKRLSLQKHNFRSEVWTSVKGSPHVQIDGVSKILHPGQTCFIPVGSTHRLENNTNEPIEIIEVQTGESFCEDDIIRLEDDFYRA